MFACSAQIEALVGSANVQKAVDRFTDLSKIYSTVKDSQCSNIVKYAKESTLHWYKILKDKCAR